MTEETTAPDAGAEQTIEHGTGASLERAFKDYDWGDAEPAASEPAAAEAAEDEAPEADEPSLERDERGRFKAREAGEQAEAPDDQAPAEVTPSRFEAPSGLSAEGKAAWDATPEPVKADIARRFREMEQGIQGYQSEYGALKPYADRAKAEGTSLAQVVQNYVGFEQLLLKDPKAGFEAVARSLNIDIGEVLGQPAAPDVRQLQTQLHTAQREAETAKAELAKFHEEKAKSEVDEFARDHPRIDELGPTMAWLIQTGGAQTLDDAYQLADRLRPSATPPAPAPAHAAVQTRTPPVSRSISGAPASGSNPAARKPAGSTSEALERAFAATGM